MNNSPQKRKKMLKRLGKIAGSVITLTAAFAGIGSFIFDCKSDGFCKPIFPQQPPTPQEEQPLTLKEENCIFCRPIDE